MKKAHQFYSLNSRDSTSTLQHDGNKPFTGRKASRATQHDETHSVCTTQRYKTHAKSILLNTQITVHIFTMLYSVKFQS